MDAPKENPVTTASTLFTASANRLMVERRLDPCMSEVLPWDQIPQAHTKMMKNEHKPGNMAVLVQSPRIGLSTFEEVIK